MVETKTTVTCDFCGKDLSDCQVTTEYSPRTSEIKHWNRVVLSVSPYVLNPRGTPYPTKDPVKQTFDLCDECYAELCHILSEHNEV